MINMNRLKFWSILALGASLWLPVSPLQAGKLYKWVDETGQVRYGDHIPAKYAKKSNETLNTQGVVVDSKAALKSAEQRAEEQRLAEMYRQKGLPALPKRTSGSHIAGHVHQRG